MIIVDGKLKSKLTDQNIPKLSNIPKLLFKNGLNSAMLKTNDDIANIGDKNYPRVAPKEQLDLGMPSDE